MIRRKSTRREAQPGTAGKRFLAAPTRLFQAGAERVWVLNRLTGDVEVLERSVAEVLLNCRGLRTLESHAGALEAKALGAPTRGELTATLEELRDRGLLYSEHVLQGALLGYDGERSKNGISEVTEGQAELERGRIRDIVVPTRARPAEVERLLRSIESARTEGGGAGTTGIAANDGPGGPGAAASPNNDTPLHVHLIDDARAGEEPAPEGQRGPLNAVPGIQILRRSRSSRPALLDQVADKAGLDSHERSVLRFALGFETDAFDTLGGQTARQVLALGTTGAARNAGLLATSGSPVVQVDDDIVCSEPARPPAWERAAGAGQPRDAEEGDKGEGGRRKAAPRFLPARPQELAFLREAEDRLRDAAERPVDIVGEAEPFIGRSVAEVLHELGGEHPDLSAVGSNDLLTYCRPDARVRIVSYGIHGDGGFGLPQFLLTDPRVWWMVGEDPEAYEWIRRSRRVCWVSAHPTLTGGGTWMAYGAAIDNARIVPPFFPVGRASDRSFAQLLTFADPAAVLLYLPAALRHVPPPGRASAHGERLRGARGRTDTYLLALLDGCERPPSLSWDRFWDREWLDSGRHAHDAESHSSLSEELSKIGRHLRAIGAYSDRLFEELLRERALRGLAGYARQLEECLDERTARNGSPQAPELWVRDVEALIENLDDTIAHRRVPIPEEFRSAGITEEGEFVRLFKVMVGLYGELLTTWPAIWEAARRLHAR